MANWQWWRGRSAEDDDLNRELEVHLAIETEEQLAGGKSPEHATRAAHRAFGSVSLTKDELADLRRGAWLERLAQEMKYATRRLMRTPVFTLATVLTLGLAMAATVTMFAVLHRVVLNPLPYRDSARLVALDHGMPDRHVPSGVNMTALLYYAYLDRARTLESVAVYRVDERNLTGAQVPERIRVCRTTPSLSTVLGVGPEIGRWFTNDEGVTGAPTVGVLSHGLWVRWFGANPGVLGERVTVDGVPTTVIGVMPASFVFPDSQVDLWIPDPLSATLAASGTLNGVYDFSGIARMRDGVDVRHVRPELTRVAHELGLANRGQGYDRLVSTATTLIEATVGRIEVTLWMLFGAVSVVMLIAGANVANLLLVRSEAKQREIAVRRAIGAGPGGIATYFCTEAAWLALMAGLVAYGLAFVGVRVLVAVGPRLPRLDEIRLDPVTFEFAAGLMALACIGLSVIPWLRLESLPVSLRDSGGRQTATRARHRLRQLLMAAQVALALVLLVASGLLLRSFVNIRNVNPGFDPHSALTFRIGLPAAEYDTRDQTVTAHRAILDRLSTLPGATIVAAASCLPLAEQGCFAGPLFVEGRPIPRDPTPPLIRFLAASGGYFQTMRIPLLRGRAITRADGERNEAVVIVNQALADLVFPGEEPLGQHVRIGNPSSSRNPEWLTIVGVAANTSYRALAERAAVPMMYMPLMARVINIGPQLRAMNYVIRTSVSPESLTEAAHRATAQVDTRLALAQVRPLQEVLDQATAQWAFTAILIVTAAGFSLVLGLIGIYGVTSYIVSQRTGEIAVRLALGATPAAVVRMVVQQGGLVIVAGVGVGFVTAWLASRLIGSQLYGVTPRDPKVAVLAATMLTGTALIACWLPARRAAGLSPVDALKSE